MAVIAMDYSHSDSPSTAPAGITHVDRLRPLLIVGPTGAGKSDLSHEVARRLDQPVEIINGDSMQMYRGMDIGTAKISRAERAEFPHHLFDCLDVDDTASVAAYREMAGETVEQIQARGARPIIVGGSMMYLQALVDDWQFPPTDSAVRAKWMAEQDRIGVEALHEVLRSKDPDAADIIEEKDPRRIVRALEVIELTGKPFAASQPPKNVPTRWGTRIFGLKAPGNWLNPRLEARVDRMFAAGLVAEVEGLAAAGLSRESTAGKAIGYAQVLSALAGECSMEQAREDTVVGTRRYARRQRSWFRRDPRIHWLDATVADPGLLAGQVIDGLRETTQG